MGPTAYTTEVQQTAFWRCSYSKTTKPTSMKFITFVVWTNTSRMRPERHFYVKNSRRYEALKMAFMTRFRNLLILLQLYILKQRNYQTDFDETWYVGVFRRKRNMENRSFRKNVIWPVLSQFQNVESPKSAQKVWVKRCNIQKALLQCKRDLHTKFQQNPFIWGGCSRV